MQIGKIVWGFVPGPHWGELTAPTRLPSCTTVFLLATLVEKPAPKKIAGYDTGAVTKAYETNYP